MSTVGHEWFAAPCRRFRERRSERADARWTSSPPARGDPRARRPSRGPPAGRDAARQDPRPLRGARLRRRDHARRPLRPPHVDGARSRSLIGGPFPDGRRDRRVLGVADPACGPGRLRGVQPQPAAGRGCRCHLSHRRRSTGSRASCAIAPARARKADGGMLVDGIISDITAREQAAARLAEASDRFTEPAGRGRRARLSGACPARTAASRSCSRAPAATACSAAPSPTRAW